MRPTREEVIEHFKDAEEVECLFNGEIINVKDFTIKGIHEFEGNYWADYSIEKSDNSALLWHDSKGYAKITKPQATHYGNRPDVIDFNKKYDLNFNLGSAVKYLARAGKKQGESKESDLNKALDFIKRELEVIEPETVNAKDGLEVVNWYVTHNGKGLLMWNNGDICTGFWEGVYAEKTWSWYDARNGKPATDKEVKEALIKEAQRRYKVGDIIKWCEGLINVEYFLFKNGKVFVNNESICYDGKGEWAAHA